MIEFLTMDGDGVFVWPCYVLTVLVLAGNVWVARSRHAALLKRAKLRARQGLHEATNPTEATL